ncbi:hypothetical protein HK103_004952 [Boothiomyces macroporosus]|uniref:Uncharacterized protein n=1 Tax=Boothiomyces macroporosus TaxID=261099 RepID=A0AAD5UFX6_9FUNG|nr:hypothetical protein HK103_004952 [Boothiomyces macroporosus]
MAKRVDIATAPVSNQSNFNRSKVDRDDYLSKTAPAVLKAEPNRFFIPAISPATQKQNYRLANLIKLLQKSNTNDRLPKINGVEANEFNRDSMAVAFDKNWSELMKLIGNKNINAQDYAKLLNDSDSGIDFTPNADDYGDIHQNRMNIDVKKQIANAAGPLATMNINQQSQKSIIGRKPVRAIMNDLSKRIQMLKTNPVQWEILQQKVVGYTRQTKSAGDHIHLNKKLAWEANLKRAQIETQTTHAARMSNLKRNRAAIVIQRWYRKFLYAKVEEMKRKALIVIGKAFKVFYVKWKNARLRLASDIIQSFFQEVYDVSKLMKIVKKYRFSVIKAQRYCKTFLKIRECRIVAISKHWENMEGVWWSQRGKGGKGSTSELDDKKPKSKKKKKKEDDKISLRIAENIKHRVILENLVERRKAYLKALIEKQKENAEAKVIVK